MSARPDAMKISACVTAGNEEDKIAECLKALAWCDEVIVVDSYSKDCTFEISKQYATKAVQHPWEGYIGQKNYIRSLASCPWILFVDADEVVSPDLREEIETLFATEHEDAAGYQIPRMVHYLGRWIRHGEWYPDRKLRLFRKDKGHSGGEEPHDRVVVDGPVKNLRHPLYHYTYDDVADHLNTINRFSTISAKAKLAKGARHRWSNLLFRPLWRFFRSYFLKLGFLDGGPGLLVAIFASYGVFCKYAKIYEAQKNAGRGKS